MSVKPFVMFPKEILFHNHLSIHSKLFFSSLLHWDRSSGRGCFASRQTMSKMTGLSLYHIRESIKELVDLGLITETRRGLGQTNLIHIVMGEEDNQDDVGETISSLNVKSVDVSSYNSIKETSLNRVDDDTDFPSDLEEEKQRTESDSQRLEVEEDNLHREDIDCLLEDTETLLESISTRVKPTGMIYFQNLKVIGIDNEEITLYESNEVIRDWLKKKYRDLLADVSGGRVVKILSGSETKEKI
jgi:hypothetical protein